jgi:hypothetical protein
VVATALQIQPSRFIVVEVHQGRTALTPADRIFLGGGGQDEAGPAEFSGWGWPEKAGQVTGTIPAQHSASMDAR